ncbi:MAG: MerR family transcriptional regulator [Chloroflexota bacterium]
MYINKLLIHELAEQAKTTIRTIRYYADEGLLPQPEIQGKYAYYSQEHVNRLELIRRMKDSYLPLKEIRQVLLSLSDDEVKQRLQEYDLSPSDQSKPALDSSDRKSGEKALEYISQILGEQSTHRKNNIAQTPVQYQAGRLRSEKPVTGLMVTTISQSETWHHIQIRDGIELNIRQPVDPVLEQKIHQLITYSKKLF